MLKEHFIFIEETKPEKGDGWFTVPADKIQEVCRYLKSELKFNVLSCLTGTDKGEFFEVVYHLFASEKKEALVLKVKITRDVSEVPSVPTVSDVWAAANWMERETFELLGIEFKGHPELKNLLLPEDWVGQPLRKDYKEQPEYAGMTTTR